jgi:hypothetical protein
MKFVEHSVMKRGEVEIKMEARLNIERVVKCERRAVTDVPTPENS